MPQLLADDKPSGPVYSLSSIHAHYRHARPSQYELTVGSQAPNFELADVRGDKVISLSRLRGKPIVLIGGSQTCKPFCNTLVSVKSLYRQYGSKAQFIMVYLDEAHPADDLFDPSSKRPSAGLLKAHQLRQKREYALKFARDRNLQMPVLVDTMDKRTEIDYDLGPSRIMVIGPDGRFAYVGGHGPMDFHPREAAPVLDSLISAQHSARLGRANVAKLEQNSGGRPFRT